MINTVVAPEKEPARAATVDAVTGIAEAASDPATDAGTVESGKTAEAEQPQKRIDVSEEKDPPALLIPACGVLCDAFWWARNRK